MAESIESSVDVLGPMNEKLVGTWKLLSASSTASSGVRNETPYGQQPYRLSHVYRGWQSNRHDQPRLAGSHSLSAEGLTRWKNRLRHLRHFLPMADGTRVSGDKVTHHVEISSIQMYVGKRSGPHRQIRGRSNHIDHPTDAVGRKDPNCRIDLAAFAGRLVI